LNVNSSEHEIENALYFNAQFFPRDFVAILRNCKLSKEQKIDFLDRLFVCTERISTSIAQSYDDIFLLSKTVIQSSDLEAIINKFIRTRQFDDDVDKTIRLAMQLETVNFRNIMISYTLESVKNDM